MNSSILENNEEVTEESRTSRQEQSPSIMEDYNNPLQASVAVSYFKWKEDQAAHPRLSELFAAAERQSRRLAVEQEQKIS